MDEQWAFPGDWEKTGGMTLLDYFAGQILTKLGADNYAEDIIAARAYKLADAMMKVREKLVKTQ